MGPQLVLKKINLNKASDRIRISKWPDEFDEVFFWRNIFNLLFLIIYKLNSKKIFLLSKEINLKGLIVIILCLLNKNYRSIIDICDLFTLKKNLSFREKINKFFVDIIIRNVDLIIVPSIELKNKLEKIVNTKKIIIIEDELDLDYLPRLCYLPRKNRKVIGWFGNSGFLSHNYFVSIKKRKLKLNSSFSLFSKIIKKSIESNLNIEFILLTNNIDQIRSYLNNFIGSKYIKYVKIKNYNIYKINEFFSSIDQLIITYGNEDFSKTKSTNRVDTGLWLVKDVQVLNNPYSRNVSSFKTKDLIVESKDINDCFLKMIKSKNHVNLERLDYFKFINLRKNENKIKRKEIIEKIWTFNNDLKKKLSK